MDHGIFLPIFEWWIGFLNKINCVEWFKNSATKIFKTNDTRKVKRISIDVFILLKYLFLILLWVTGINNSIITFIIIYLLFMNFHTYFYYHLWDDRAISDRQVSIGRVKGRFITFTLAFIYNIISYGYLYAIPFQPKFEWTADFPINTAAISMSFSKTVGGSFEYVKPLTDVGLILSASQIIVTFLFVAVLLSKSLPFFNEGGE